MIYLRLINEKIISLEKDQEAFQGQYAQFELAQKKLSDDRAHFEAEKLELAKKNK